jgi:hypothetical protein
MLLGFFFVFHDRNVARLTSGHSSQALPASSAVGTSVENERPEDGAILSKLDALLDHIGPPNLPRVHMVSNAMHWIVPPEGWALRNPSDSLDGRYLAFRAEELDSTSNAQMLVWDGDTDKWTEFKSLTPSDNVHDPRILDHVWDSGNRQLYIMEIYSEIPYPNGSESRDEYLKYNDSVRHSLRSVNIETGESQHIQTILDDKFTFASPAPGQVQLAYRDSGHVVLQTYGTDAALLEEQFIPVNTHILNLHLAPSDNRLWFENGGPVSEDRGLSSVAYFDLGSPGLEPVNLIPNAGIIDVNAEATLILYHSRLPSDRWDYRVHNYSTGDTITLGEAPLFPRPLGINRDGSQLYLAGSTDGIISITDPVQASAQLGVFRFDLPTGTVEP